MNIYINAITKYDIYMVLINLNLSKWNGQHHKPITLSKLLLRRYANETVIFHFTWFSKARWTHFLVKLHLIPGNKRFLLFLFVCLFHNLILLYRKQSFIIRPSEKCLLNFLSIVQFWKSYIRKEAMVIQVKLNGNWQAIPNTYRQGQVEGNIQERVLQLDGLKCGCLEIGI